MLHFTDMMGHPITLDTYPKRIVSVVPSQTELLHTLGLQEEVVGITKFCVHPKDWFSSKKRIGGTKTLHIEAILALQPDLILANKEENTLADIAALQQHVPVWVSDIHTVADAFHMIKAVGELVNQTTAATQLLERLQSDFHTLPAVFNGKKVAYFIWKNPWMVAAGDTFIHTLLTRLGAENVFGHLSRYPEVNDAMIRASGADLLLLSSEPFPFKEIHAAALNDLLPQAQILLVDGEVFSWYGSRLQYLKSYVATLGGRLQ